MFGNSFASSFFSDIVKFAFAPLPYIDKYEGLFAFVVNTAMPYEKQYSSSPDHAVLQMRLKSANLPI
jgi:hypothetical protein